MESKLNIARAGGFLVAFLVFGSLNSARAASLYFSPGNKEVAAGQNLTVTVYTSSADQALNAVSGEVRFPADILSATGISKSGSIISLWAQEPSFSNNGSAGSVKFEGVALNPGFTGTGGRVISITFQAKKVGSAAVTFASASVLANDGLGTNILNSLGSAEYRVGSAAVPADTAEGELPPLPAIKFLSGRQGSEWTNAASCDFSWEIPEGVDAISYVLDTSPLTTPSTRGDTITKVQYSESQCRDGSSYFHIQFRNKSGWGPVAHRKINVDRTPPSTPVIVRNDEGDATNPRPDFSWSSRDVLSGMERYDVQIGNGSWFTPPPAGQEGHLLPLQPPGKHSIRVRALDRAGNTREAELGFEVESLPTPLISHHSARISSGENFVVNGTAVAKTTLVLEFESGKNTFSHETAVNAEGVWSFAGATDMSTGAWGVRAYVRDSRGALSLKSAPVFATVRSWSGDLFRNLGLWGVIAGAGIVILAGLFALAYFLTHRLRLWRGSLRRELWQFRVELRQDLKKLEEELGVETGQEIDLSPSKLRKTRRKIEKGVAVIEEDITKEIKRLDQLK